MVVSNTKQDQAKLFSQHNIDYGWFFAHSNDTLTFSATEMLLLMQLMCYQSVLKISIKMVVQLKTQVQQLIHVAISLIKVL